VRKVLLVEDNADLAFGLRTSLEVEGYDVVVAPTGPDGLESVRRDAPDLVVLDLMLPGMSGYDVLRTIRREGFDMPVLVVSAKSEEVDKVQGFRLGADDYVVKPFSPRELVARIKTVLRRSQTGPSPAMGGVLRFDGCAINPESRSVTTDSGPVQLTGKEFDLLFFLASNPGRVFTRDQLMDQVWDFTYAGDVSTVTVHIRRLRKKLEADPVKPRYIKTVWGVGYKFES